MSQNNLNAKNISVKRFSNLEEIELVLEAIKEKYMNSNFSFE